MGNLEKTLVPEQASTGTRSLSPAVRQRVILRLTSFGPEPLTHEGAARFSHVLHGDKKHADYTLSVSKGSYYLDFAAPDHHDPLVYAVEQTDTALLKTALPAAIVGAWVVSKDAPSVSELTNNGLEQDRLSQLREVTQDAKEILDHHRSSLLDEAFTRLLFEAA